VELDVFQADMSNPMHAESMIALLDHYAQDEMGGGRGLSKYVKDNVAQAINARPSIKVFLARHQGLSIGMAIAMESFSTFACKPIVNIHDLVVSNNYRRRGVALSLLKHVEMWATELGCCKLTLEVLEGNYAGVSAYAQFGFQSYELNPKFGKALFLQKCL
jgi:GNAT superfamily N-acetyltransferase